jgi:hypothetical protein
MANSAHLFRVDGRLDELVVRIRPWSDDVVDKLGFDPRSSYVEDFWLGILGPSTTWLLRRLAAGFDYSPGGFGLDLAETARSLGLGDRSGQHSPFVRSLNRTVQFGLAQVSGPEELSVRRRLPPLNRAQLLRLSPALQARHAAWPAEQLAMPAAQQQRRASQLALSTVQRGPARSAGLAPVRASSSPSQDALLSQLADRRGAPRPRALAQRATGVLPGKSAERS